MIPSGFPKKVHVHAHMHTRIPSDQTDFAWVWVGENKSKKTVSQCAKITTGLNLAGVGCLILK